MCYSKEYVRHRFFLLVARFSGANDGVARAKTQTATDFHR